MLPFSKRVIYRMPAGVKEDSMSENNNIVKGYCFGTAEDAETARQEEKKIEYLEQHMDLGKTENMLLVYKKAVESRIFVTPVGWEYLKRLQRELNSRADLDRKSTRLNSSHIH